MFETIKNFFISLFTEEQKTDNDNNQIIKNLRKNSEQIDKITGDTDENTSNIRYNRIFPPKPFIEQFIEPFNCELSIIDKNIEEKLFQESSLLNIIDANKNTIKNKESSLDNLKITFNPRDNLLKSRDENFKPLNRGLIKEFNEVANHRNNPETLISLKYNNIKTSRIGTIVKNCS